jgi:hypothetical protein
MHTTDGIEWWAGIAGEPVGPLSAADVRTCWEAGEITPETLVWRSGFAEWKPAAEVPELAALRSAPKPAAAWKPGAGSALAALAGKELASLEPPERPATAAPDTPGRPAPAAAAAPAARTTPAAPAGPAAPPTPPATRWSVLASAGGTFAMGAALAVALFVAFRGGERFRAAGSAAPAARTASSVPSPIAVTAPAPGASAAAEASGPVGPVATTGGADAVKPGTGNGPAQAAEPVRASNPPAPPKEATTAAAPPQAKDDDSPRKVTAAERREVAPARKAARTARTPAETRRPRASKPAEEPVRVAAATPRAVAPKAAPASNDPLASLDASPQDGSSQRARTDPLASLISDDELDRELSNGEGAAATPPAASRSAPPAQAGPASPSSAVYVPPAPAGGLPEGVTPAQINSAVKARLSALRGCIDEQRAAEPGSKGTLNLRWVIAADGTVKELRNISPEFEGKPISRCIGGVVREIRFPPSRTSGQEVVFPFKF